MKWKQFIDEFGGGLKKYQKAGEIKNEDTSYINFVRSLPSNLQQPNDPSYNLKGYWEALGNPESFDYNQPTDSQGYYHAFSRDPYTGQILKAPFHPSFKEGVNDEDSYRLVDPRGNIYTQGFRYPAHEGYYALPKMDKTYNFLDIPNYEGYFEQGGSLPQFQPGGTNKPIYTSDWGKVKNYNDSLNLYNGMVMQDRLMGEFAYNLNDPMDKVYARRTQIWTPSVLRQNRYNNVDFQNEADMFSRPGFWARPEDRRLLNYYRSLGFTDNNIMFHSSPDLVHPTIRAIGSYHDGTAWSPVYKKPVQPYIYQKPDPYKEFLGRLGDVKPMGIRPMDVGMGMPIMPKSIEVPMRTKTLLPAVKHYNNYSPEFDIINHTVPGERFHREVIIPMEKERSKPEPKEIKPAQGKRTSNPKVVYQNYKQAGGEQSTEENPKVLPLANVSSKKADWVVDKEKHGIDEIKWYESWNPKKWGLNDYSEYSSFNSAFRNARENKEEEFVYKGKRYNTQLIPKEDSDLYWESKNFLKDYYKNQPYKKIDDDYDYDFNRNRDPYIKSKYGNTWMELYEMQKQIPIGNPEWDEIQKKMNDISDEEKTISQKKNKEYDAYYKKNVIDKQSGERIASLDKPTYFSITNQKPKDMREDGYWNPKENKMFMLTNTEPGKLNTTYIHELSHKGDHILDVMNTVPRINIEAFNAAPYKQDFTQESFNYVSNPSETEARKLSTLFYLKKNKQPWKAGKITEETLDKLYQDHYDKKLPYDIGQLLMLYGAQRDDLLKYLNGDFEYNYKPEKKKKGGESNLFNWSNLDQWFKNGGESDFANNIYDDYMTGIYDGTPLEGYAKKVYDKLNTMYYTQAKQAGMTPSNYIMTNVIKKSTTPS